MRRLSAELLEAYRATSYVAEADDDVIVLRVGERCPELIDLMKRRGVKTAAYIAAFSVRHPQDVEEETRKRQEELDRLIKQCRYESYVGQALSDEGDWPEEDSRLVLGVTQIRAGMFSGKFGQSAFVFVRLEDERPVLFYRDTLIYWWYWVLSVVISLVPVAIFVNTGSNRIDFYMVAIVMAFWSSFMTYLAYWVGYREVRRVEREPW